MPVRPRLVWGTVVVLMVLVSGAYGYNHWVSDWNMEWPLEQAVPDPDSNQMNGGYSINQAQNPAETYRLKPETRIVFEMVYQPCGYRAVEQRSPHPEEIGLTPVETAEHLGDWDLIERRGHRIQFKRERSGGCPALEAYRTLQLKDNRLVIFRGSDTRFAPVVRELEITDGVLPESDRVRLEKGVTLPAAEAAVFTEGIMQ